MAQETSLEKKSTTPAGDENRSIDEIRQDIEKTRQNISGTVDVLGTKLQKQLDWREYVRRKPLVAVGIGLGAGFVLSRMIVSKPKPRFSMGDLIADTIAKTVGQIMRPQPESMFKSAAKMIGGALVTQVVQSLQPPQEEAELHHQHQYAHAAEFAERRQ
ncbi:MAG TPA: DUF3618 domain-containing protein [Blastocatellia bacterium]|nr:DUF3618 domain-containing protein [Blastocatellia bacterium]